MFNEWVRQRWGWIVATLTAIVLLGATIQATQTIGDVCCLGAFDEFRTVVDIASKGENLPSLYGKKAWLQEQLTKERASRPEGWRHLDTRSEERIQNEIRENDEKIEELKDFKDKFGKQP